MQSTDSKSEPGQPGPNSRLRNLSRGKKISCRRSMACPNRRLGRGDGHGKLNVKIHLSVGNILRSNSLKSAKGVNRKQSPQRRAAELRGGGGG